MPDQKVSLLHSLYHASQMLQVLPQPLVVLLHILQLLQDVAEDVATLQVNVAKGRQRVGEIVGVGVAVPIASADLDAALAAQRDGDWDVGFGFWKACLAKGVTCFEDLFYFI